MLPLSHLSATSGCISIASFVTIIGASVRITSPICSLALSISTRIVKKLLKTTQKKKKHNKIVMLTWSKLNSINSKTSVALINKDISHEEKSYRELKESIRVMNSQRTDTVKINLIEEGKKIGIDEAIKQNEFINNSLKSKI